MIQVTISDAGKSFPGNVICGPEAGSMAVVEQYRGKY